MTQGSSRYPADITCGSFYTTGSGCWTLLSYFHQHFVANTFQAYVLTAICTSLGAKPGFGELYSGRAVDLQLPPHSFHLFSSFLSCASYCFIAQVEYSFYLAACLLASSFTCSSAYLIATGAFFCISYIHSPPPVISLRTCLAAFLFAS